ncbi:hypothetical protein OAM14_03700 [Candidatus Pelagibacter sp.]|nr:hypothetical protein [Candidatus Pelagibacter sp.]
MQEFDVLKDFYNPIREQEKLYSSKEYRLLKENNIDTAEIEDIEPDENAGEIVFNKDEKISDEDNQIFLKDISDFVFKDLPRDTLISVLRGGNNGFRFLNNFAMAVMENEGIDPNSMTFNNDLNDKFEKIKSDLDNADKDSPLVSKLMAIAAQDGMYTYPIYKKLKKAGVPMAWRTPIAFGLGGALAFDKTESFLVDSSSMKNLKGLIGIAEDTPIDELYDKTVQAVEFGAFGKIFEKIFDVGKSVKTMNKDRLKQADIAVGASAGSAAVVEQFVDDDPNQASTDTLPNIEPSEEKKNLNFNDDEIIPGTVNEYGFEKTSSLVPVFKSILKETAKKLPNKGSGEQILNTLKNTPGVKQQELKWSGLDDFLKEKKTATKEEVKEYLENNSLDVSEVKFGSDVKTLKLSEDVEFKKNEFERKVLADIYKKDPELRGEVPEELLEDINYDLFAPIAMTADGVKDKVMPMDFNTMRTILGENPNIANFKKLPNGNLRNLNNADVDFFDKGYFEINPFDFEKYQVEEAVRKFRQNDIKAPKFEQHTEPGGEEYTELVFKIKKGGIDVGIPVEIRNAETTTIKNNPFRSPAHMNVKSEIAHVRFKTRMNGNMKVLTVEEMQSDFGIRAAKENKVFAGEKPKIADFPFKNNWYELTTKRLIRYAADNNFDAVAIPKGSVPAKRYGEFIDKVKTVSVQKNPLPTHHEVSGKKLKYEGNAKNEYVVRYFDEDGMDVLEKVFTDNNLKNLEKEIGLKKFNELVNLEKTKKLQIGTGDVELPLDKPIILGSGKGKAELYDKAIPSFLKKYGKKWNAKVYDDEINYIQDPEGSFINNEGSIPVTIIQLTDEMKQSVQQDGQALFNIFGIGSGAAIGSNAILDSDRNNTISNITEN